MGSARKELTINAKPEDVWDAVRDFGALHARAWSRGLSRTPASMAKQTLENAS
jgi:hypothetical protein